MAKTLSPFETLRRLRGSVRLRPDEDEALERALAVLEAPNGSLRARALKAMEGGPSRRGAFTYIWPLNVDMTPDEWRNRESS